jgi:ribonucleoside-diphosphate reductase beta chain
MRVINFYLYNEFQITKDTQTFLKVLIANYILEGVYFYSGFMFFYNLGRNGKMPGSAQEIRYINRDENTHLWLFRSILLELKKENPELFTSENIYMCREMIKEGVEQEIQWGHYVIGDDISGLNKSMISDYIRYLGNLRCTNLVLIPFMKATNRSPNPCRGLASTVMPT